jgi:hypothetical protein
LSSFGRDSLQILLSRSIGIADLKKKTLLANGLAMELLDDLLADITRLEAIEMVSLYSGLLSKDSLPSETNTTTVVLAVTKDSA